MKCEIRSPLDYILYLFTLFVKGVLLMKECPICHAMNGDGSETCYNCHTPFKFSTKDEEVERNNESPKYGTCHHCGVKITKEESLCKKCKSSKTKLKITLYIISIVIYSIITTLLRMSGILLGAIPTMILFAIFLYLPNYVANGIYEERRKDIEKVQKLRKAKKTSDCVVKKKYCKQKKVKEKYCKHCGGLIDNKTKKCTSCNKQYFHPIRHINNILNKLESKQAKYCKKCGGLIDENTRKCSNCGKQYFRFCFNKKAAIITISVISVALISLVVIFLTTFKVYSDDIVIISRSACRGDTAYVSIHAEPYTKYNITVTYDDGSKENIGAAQRETGIAGEVTWQWYVSKYTSPGECKIRIESDREYNTETIQIY